MTRSASRDSLGNAVTVAEPATLQGINDFIEGFLAYETRAVNVLAAAKQDEGSALANVYAGFLHLFLESPGASAAAEPFLRRAEAAAPRATRREQMITAFARAWSGDDVPRALRLAKEIIAEHPRDLTIAKLAQYHAFNRGESARMLRIAKTVHPHNEENPHSHGMLAFAYEQCHLLAEAERAAMRALEIKRKEPWAQHAIAHVRLTEGRIADGARFLEGVKDTWLDLNSFMDTHLWWHLALFYLSEGRREEVLALYDRHVWAREKSYTQDQIGAVSLLARLELAGIAVGDRWRELGGHLAARARDTVNPFLSLQYLYGLARAGREEAETLLGAIRERGRIGDEGERPVWSQMALPAAEGVIAHARGEFARAAEAIGRARPRLQEGGGSHAQRDLFELLFVDSLVRAGRCEEAQQHLELRRRSDPDGVPVNNLLGEVYERLGLPEEARSARRRASRAPA